MATWASSTCTMTDGKQAAWATMLSSGERTGTGNSGSGEDNSSSSPPPSGPAATLTGSDLVKGGEMPVLLASDSLGRVGLLRYPAQLPPEPILPTAAPVPPVEGAGDGAEEGAANADVPPAPTPEEAEAAAAAAAAAMAEAVDAAVPRVRSHAYRP